MIEKASRKELIALLYQYRDTFSSDAWKSMLQQTSQVTGQSYISLTAVCIAVQDILDREPLFPTELETCAVCEEPMELIRQETPVPILHITCENKCTDFTVCSETEAELIDRANAAQRAMRKVRDEGWDDSRV